MTINYREDKQEMIKGANDAKTLSDKVIKLKSLEDEVSNAEESLKKLKEQVRILSQLEIPQMMEEMNITKLKLKDGESVEVKKFYSASIPKEKQQEAFTWLRNNGLGDVIKNDITVTFGRGEDNKAAQYAVLARGQGFEPVQKVGVNPMTLKALVRERLESGQEMPSDLFNTYAGNSTKINRGE